MGSNCLKATEPLRIGSLLFTAQSPGVPGTHMNDLGSWQVEWTVEPSQGFNLLTTNAPII